MLGTKRVGNPFVTYSVVWNEYLLFYSASSIHLQDSNIDEPIFLGLASSPNPWGPWSRFKESPLLINPGFSVFFSIKI